MEKEAKMAFLAIVLTIIYAVLVAMLVK